MKIKAYKGFHPDMTCRDFQYDEGKSYETARAAVCEEGFHACEYPLDCFGYYEPGKAVYHEVELDGDMDRSSDDSKVAATKIKIGARLDIAGLCRAAFEYVRSRCTNENNAEPGKPATAGDNGAATAGSYGAATAGYKGAATAGYNGAATAGYNGAATAGDNGAATAGDNGAATAGSYGAATAGDNGAATAKGSVCVGENGVGSVRGNGVKARGGLGAVLLIAVEEDCSYDIKEWRAIRIDGKKFKPDTWYTLRDGKIVEVEP